MFLLGSLVALLLLPLRLLLWGVGLFLWVVTLPVRLGLGVLGLIGLGRLARAGAMAAAGYYFYRLVSQPAPAQRSEPSQH
jgi:hypothetical protein